MGKVTYWKASKALSAKINALFDADYELLKEASELSKRYGGHPRDVYTVRAFGDLRLSGLVFKDESKVDKKLFKRLKSAKNGDGWEPRQGSGEALCKLRAEFDKLRGSVIAGTMKLIDMNMFKGHNWRVPGIRIVDGIAYLTVAEDVIPKDCTRISDLEFEKATGKEPKKRKTSV